MTTPIFWKSVAISNQILKFVLPYPTYGFWDHKTQRFTAQKSFSFGIKLCFLASLTLLFTFIYVIIQALLIKSISLSMSRIMFQLLFVCTMAILYSSVVMVVPNSNILGCQYYNSLIIYDRAMFKKKHEIAADDFLAKLVLKGKLIQKHMLQHF